MRPLWANRPTIRRCSCLLHPRLRTTLGPRPTLTPLPRLTVRGMPRGLRRGRTTGPCLPSTRGTRPGHLWLQDTALRRPGRRPRGGGTQVPRATRRRRTQAPTAGCLGATSLSLTHIRSTRRPRNRSTLIRNTAIRSMRIRSMRIRSKRIRSMPIRSTRPRRPLLEPTEKRLPREPPPVRPRPGAPWDGGGGGLCRHGRRPKRSLRGAASSSGSPPWSTEAALLGTRGGGRPRLCHRASTLGTVGVRDMLVRRSMPHRATASSLTMPLTTGARVRAEVGVGGAGAEGDERKTCDAPSIALTPWRCGAQM